MEMKGFEPSTFRMRTERSPTEPHPRTSDMIHQFPGMRKGYFLIFRICRYDCYSLQQRQRPLAAPVRVDMIGQDFCSFHLGHVDLPHHQLKLLPA